MSLILEALRKSEAERRRGQAPGVATELPPPAAGRAVAVPRWAWPAAALALAVPLALGWQARPRGAAVPTEPDRAAADAPPAAAPALPAVVPHSRAPGAPAPIAAPPAAATTVTSRARVRPMSGPPPAPSATAPAESPATAAPPAPAPAELPDIAATALPPVKLSMHMWDADPARRFVILDGRRMQEGDRSGRLEVVEIRRDGVVLERDGQRARVPLP